MRQPRIFISYSHRDARTLTSLLPYLTTLEREGLVDVWVDTDLKGGERWEEAIEAALNSASTAVLLISQHFLASKFIYKEELPRILGRQAAGQLTVIPVFLSPSTVTSDAIIFRDGEGCEQRITLSKIQGFGTPDKTLRQLRPTDRERLFVKLSERIRELASAQGHTTEQDDTQRRHPVDPQEALSTAVQQPRISQIPHPRNPNFIGREEYLERLHQELNSGKLAAVMQAIAGLGGIGKTQLALEYSYRYGSEYNVIWWVRSEQEETRLGDLQALGQALGQSRSGMEVSQSITATLAWLDRNDNWLLVFDNVEHPSHIRDLLPKARRGHIIITSRYAAWQEVAQTVSLTLWSRGEAISYLSQRTRQQNDTAAAAIAEALGYLPLALVQAAAYIEETGCSFADYLELFQAHPAETLRLRPAASDAEKVIATIWEIAFQRVAETNPRAVELLNLFAFLPPDRIPRRLLTGQANRLPVSLAETVQDPFVLNTAITVLRSYSLIDTTEDSFSVHRLVQVAVRGRLDSENYRLFSEAARDLQDSPSPLPEGEIARKRTFWWRPLYIVLALVILSGLSGAVILVKTGISPWHNLTSLSPPIKDKDPEERRTMLSQTDVKVLTSRINATRLRYYVDRYTGKTALDDLGRITSRHIRHPDMPRIVNALVEDFKAIPNSPFHISRHEFTHEGRLLHNIVAELRGQSNDQVLITANLDSTAASSPGFNAAKDPAPGADNNGSGLAAILVIAEAFAELFQERKPRMTVRFVLFNATTQGLVGSQVYAREQALGKVNIIAVYHMQMIGFDGDKDGAFEVHAGYANDARVEQQSGWLAHRISAVRTQLSPRLSPQIYITNDPLLSTSHGDPVQGRSDHASFQQWGIPACVVTENFFVDQQSSTPKSDPNPHYRTALDTEVDYSYTADIARLVAGAAVLTVNPEPTKQFR